jgi:acyl-CoA thioester hydrolase
MRKKTMARISLTLPDTYAYSTELDVRIQDINYGNHVGHDTFISLLHEARIRYFNHLGYSETDIEGSAIVITDLAVVYKAQARHRDRLRCEIAAGEFNKYGCDIFYRMTRARDHTLILEAKTGIVFFNYLENKITPMPRAFARAVS